MIFTPASVKWALTQTSRWAFRGLCCYTQPLARRVLSYVRTACDGLRHKLDERRWRARGWQEGHQQPRHGCRALLPRAFALTVELLDHVPGISRGKALFLGGASTSAQRHLKRGAKASLLDGQARPLSANESRGATRTKPRRTRTRPARRKPAEVRSAWTGPPARPPYARRPRATTPRTPCTPCTLRGRRANRQEPWAGGQIG